MTRHRSRARDYVENMLEACNHIFAYTDGKTEDEFLADPLLQDGVVRRLEIIGEASRQLREVLPEAQARFPSLPFRTMYAMRNQPIHGYIQVDYHVVYAVVVNEISPLRAALQGILAAWPADLC